MHRGDLTPDEAYARLLANPDAILIDVRTQPEWNFVGVPAVERLVRLSWQIFPQMQINPDFVEDIHARGFAAGTEILCLCRSGARSAAAANALAEAGFTNCWNIAEGFEGDKDANNHRSSLNGWKFRGLPWIQG